MKYLVDTDWLIDVLAGIGPAASTISRLAPEGLGISIVTVGELYEGAILNPDPDGTLQRYRVFLSAFPALPLTEPIMQRFAIIRAHLRRAGMLIPDLDLLIGATALEHDLVLLTRNLRHFERIPDLHLYLGE